MVVPPQGVPHRLARESLRSALGQIEEILGDVR